MKQNVQCHILMEAFDRSPTLIAILDKNFCFVHVNHAYASNAGRRKGELIGHCHFDIYPDPENQAIFERVLQSGEEYRVTAKPFSHPDQSDRGTTWWDWQLYPITDADSKSGVEYLVLMIVDVTRNVLQSKDLEMTLVEMNHRIKNNLANVEALARVELMAGNKSKEDAIDDIISRISAIGLVHQTLYQTRSFTTVQLGSYLRELLTALSGGISGGTAAFRPVVDVPDIGVSSRVAAKVGLMLAELTTNTVKYAVCETGCEVSVRLQVTGEGPGASLSLSYCDSGSSFGPDVHSLDDLNAGTGVMILKALSSDLGGTIRLETGTTPACFIITVPYRETTR